MLLQVNLHMRWWRLTQTGHPPSIWVTQKSLTPTLHALQDEVRGSKEKTHCSQLKEVVSFTLRTHTADGDAVPHAEETQATGDGEQHTEEETHNT